jgi:hypothetical protein
MRWVHLTAAGTFHARSCKHVLVLSCMHRAADLGGTPDFEGLLFGSYAGKLLLDASVLRVPERV